MADGQAATSGQKRTQEMKKRMQPSGDLTPFVSNSVVPPPPEVSLLPNQTKKKTSVTTSVLSAPSPAIPGEGSSLMARRGAIVLSIAGVALVLTAKTRVPAVCGVGLHGIARRRVGRVNRTRRSGEPGSSAALARRDPIQVSVTCALLWLGERTSWDDLHNECSG
jgi:hypothetical protein